MLKEKLELCTVGQKDMFRRMYGHNHKEWSNDQIIDSMPQDRVNIALAQVERTLQKNGR